jgi:hypothetical protein
MYQPLELEDPNMHLKHSARRTWYAICHRPWLYGALVVMVLFAFRRILFSEPSDESFDLPSRVWEESAAEVRRAFIHAYHGYERYAAPNDELRPLSKGQSNKCAFHGFGL